jgi:predicted pyridoxine 5'-phosphate oxidase superfamily flavin-nucleotide-binding protein
VRERVVAAILAAVLVLPWGVAPALAQPRGQPPALSPSQAAFLKAESRRIEDQFVARVARIVGIDAEQVRVAMPDERRITAAVSRLVAALEHDLGRALSDQQKAAIHAADAERRAALARVREGAWQR